MMNYKHHHGTANQVMTQEEAAMLLCVERALASSSNSQTIGRNGEIPLLTFLQRYLPVTLRAVSGHFITPSGKLSPQLDVIVIDARYPLLSENSDGSVLVMLHSVIHIYEVKTNLRTRDVKKSIDNAKIVFKLTQEVEEFKAPGEWGTPQVTLFAYATAQRLGSIQGTYFKNSVPESAPMDGVILRCHASDIGIAGGQGGTLHLGPPFPGEDGQGPRPDGHFPAFIPSHTPLSDLYYTLVQNAYYTLGERDYSFNEIGAHFNEYMEWATA
jgi:hypothetical protein